MRAIISKIAGLILGAGTLFLIVGLMDVYDKWGVNTTPIEMPLENLDENFKVGNYLKIKGGRLDVVNAYEESLTYKNTDAKLNANYFIPLLNGEDKTVYILKTSLVPNFDDMIATDAEYSGLLGGSDELSEEMLAAFRKKLDFQGAVRVLDATFKAESRWDRIMRLKLAFYMIVIGLGIQFLLNKLTSKKEVQEE